MIAFQLHVSFMAGEWIKDGNIIAVGFLTSGLDCLPEHP
jgi:hypothetical protein